jgi:hypothetical protein
MCLGWCDQRVIRSELPQGDLLRVRAKGRGDRRPGRSLGQSGCAAHVSRGRWAWASVAAPRREPQHRGRRSHHHGVCGGAKTPRHTSCWARPNRLVRGAMRPIFRATPSPRASLRHEGGDQRRGRDHMTLGRSHQMGVRASRIVIGARCAGNSQREPLIARSFVTLSSVGLRQRRSQRTPTLTSMSRTPRAISVELGRCSGDRSVAWSLLRCARAGCTQLERSAVETFARASR